MKRMTKKLTAVLLALAMTLSLTVVAGAAGLTATATVSGATELKSATVELAAVSGNVTEAALSALDGVVITLSFDGANQTYAATVTGGYDVTSAGTAIADGNPATEKSFTVKDSTGTDTLATVKFKAQEDMSAYAASADFTGTITLAVSAGGANSNSGGNATSIPQSGKSEGTGTNEGGLPNAVYDVVLPTDSTTIYSMILDPHSLMADTSYKKLGGTDMVDFSDVDGHLFFKNTAYKAAVPADTAAGTPEIPAEKATYSGTSNELTVVNRSWVDVETTLDLKVTKPTESATQKTFSFTDEDFKVSGETVDGAGMYLAMVSTPTAGSPAPALSVTASGTDLSNVVTTVTDEDLIGKTISISYANTNSAYTALAASAFETGYTADMDAVAKGGNGSITVKKGTDEIGTVTFTSSGNEAADATVTLTFAAAPVVATPLNVTAGGTLAAEVSAIATTVSDTDLVGKTISLTFDGSSSYAYAALTDDAFTSGYTATMTAVGAGSNGSITVKKGASAIGTVTFTSSGREAADGTLTFTFASAGSAGDSAPTTQAVGADGKAQIKTTIAAKQDLYMKDYDTTAKKYIYTLVNASESDRAFNKIDFKLTGKINENDDWDKIAVDNTTDTGAISVELTWTISEVTPPAEPKDPTVTVTTPVTAVSGVAVLTYDLGAGNKKMDEVESFTFKNASNVASTWTTTSNPNQLSINTANKTISVTAVAPCFNGSDWTVNFKNSDGGTKAVPVNIKVAG